jgi:TPR repeat protein
MRYPASFLAILLLSCLGLPPAFAAKKERPSLDAPPQLISTEGSGPKWRNTKELKAHAAKGDPQACFELGTRLLDGDDEVTADLAQARALLEKAADGGVGDAQFRLGKIYHDGRGVPRDYAKALEYYTAAARRGVPEAQHNIGAMLVSARGVKRNYIEGLAWLLLAEHSGAASDAPRQVRERLARRPADIQAAEARAEQLSADLPNATVHTGMPTVPVGGGPQPVPPSETKPVITPSLSRPKIDPIAPPKIAVPLDQPPSSPR